MDCDVAVVGGGISGLSAARELVRRRPGLQVVVLEGEDTAGGKVRSSREEGFLFDWGPNGFQPAEHTLELVSQMELDDRLVAATPAGRTRYLVRDGALRRVPGSPPQFLSTELLSPLGKLRAAAEPLLARTPWQGGEETVFDFAQRHFGRQAAELAAAAVLGVTAGDARRLSLDALFPRMRALEAEHGSLIRGMIAARRAARGGGVDRGAPRSPIDGARHEPGAGEGGGSSRGPRGVSSGLLSFEPGAMGALSDALATDLGSRVRTGARVESLTPYDAGGFEIGLHGGERVRAASVVLAVPAFVSAALLAPLLPDTATELAAIPYANVDVLPLGFDRVDVPHRLDGFGFLAPRGEGVRSLGVLWTSALYPDRAPAGTVLLRVIAGGTVDPDFHELSDEEAFSAVRRDLRVVMGITARPSFARRLRIAKAIPQYEPGHIARVARIMKAAAGYGSLVLAGNAFHGVGVNDCIRDAQRVADDVLSAEANLSRQV